MNGVTRILCVALVTLLTLLQAPLCAAECRPGVCTDTTTAATYSPGAMDSYLACLAAAKGDTAFICRCTHEIYKCMINATAGGCNPVESRSPCWRYVNRQGMQCSQRLCTTFLPILTT